MIFIELLIIIFVIQGLVAIIIAEKLKAKDKHSNLLLSMEVSIVALAIIAISSPKTQDNFFFYIELFGIALLMLGICLFIKFYKLEY